MKKLLLLTFSLCLTLFAQGQTKVTTTAGKLRADLIAAVGGESNLGTITGLKVNGTLNAQDFADLKNGGPGNRIEKATLASVDLSGVTAVENKEIPSDAFYQFTGLKSITFPAGGVITTIGQNAFGTGGANAGLLSIVIPEGVTTLKNSAFNGQSNVTSLQLPSTLKTIDGSAFRDFKGLQGLTLPEGLTYIGAQAFYGMNTDANPTEITIPSTVEYIGEQAFALALYNNKVTFASPRNGKPLAIGGGAFRSNFYYTTSPVTFEFPENTTVFSLVEGDGIFNQMFRSNIALKEVKNLPSGIKEITNFAFSGTAIESFVVPEGVTLIGASSFRDAASLKSIVLPNSVTSIGNFAFSGTSALTSVKLGNSVQSIGTSAFSGASAVETLELPATVTAINENAFLNMGGLKALVVNNPDPIIFSTQKNVFNGINKETCILYVPAGKVTAYKDFDLWNTFANIKEIGSNAADQTLSNFNDITVTVGEVAELNVTASSGLPVTYTIADATIATLNGNKLTILKEGETTVTARQAGDNINFSPVEKTVKLLVVNYNWLEEVAITVEGSTARVAGPANSAAKFSKFYINDTEVTFTDGKADLSEKTGELSLKATTADGAEVIKAKINRQ